MFKDTPNGQTNYCCECGDEITKHDEDNSFLFMCSDCRISLSK